MSESNDKEHKPKKKKNYDHLKKHAWKPGQSGNPRGHYKLVKQYKNGDQVAIDTREVRDQALRNTKAGMKRLASIIADPNTAPRDVVSAVKISAERALGTPKQTLAIEGKVDHQHNHSADVTSLVEAIRRAAAELDNDPAIKARDEEHFNSITADFTEVKEALKEEAAAKSKGGD